jgi:hypothetical protein
MAARLRNEVFPASGGASPRKDERWPKRKRSWPPSSGGAIDLLVATTVVEVGIDIPAASSWSSSTRSGSACPSSTSSGAGWAERHFLPLRSRGRRAPFRRYPGKGSGSWPKRTTASAIAEETWRSGGPGSSWDPPVRSSRLPGGRHPPRRDPFSSSPGRRIPSRRRDERIPGAPAHEDIRGSFSGDGGAGWSWRRRREKGNVRK